MWELDCEESQVPKNWCFWSVVLDKTLESPLDCKEINQSILKEISAGCSLEGLMLKLKLQSFGHMMQRADSLEKTLMLGKTEGRRRKGCRGWDSLMASLTQWTCVWVDSRSWWWTGRPGVLQFTGSQRVGHDWATELNWTDSWACAQIYTSIHKYIYLYSHTWAFLVAQTAKNLLAMQETRSKSWVGKISWRIKWQLTPIFLPGEFNGQRTLEGYTVPEVTKSWTWLSD